MKSFFFFQSNFCYFFRYIFRSLFRWVLRRSTCLNGRFSEGKFNAYLEPQKDRLRFLSSFFLLVRIYLQRESGTIMYVFSVFSSLGWGFELRRMPNGPHWLCWDKWNWNNMLQAPISRFSNRSDWYRAWKFMSRNSARSQWLMRIGGCASLSRLSF